LIRFVDLSVRVAGSAVIDMIDTS